MRLILFVAGSSPRSTRATAGIRALQERASDHEIDVEVIDVLERPDLAEKHDIFATPTVIRVSPPPVRRVIGDLSDLGRLADALGVEMPAKGSNGQHSPRGITS